MKNKTAIFLFTKSPIKKVVKTRLSNYLKDSLVLALHKFFINESIKNINEIKSVDRYIFYYPIKNWWYFRRYKNYKLLPQKGNNFNERIFQSFQTLFEKGYTKVLCLGSDHPDLPSDFVKKAIQKLKNKEVVIGPAVDGGYYLIGVRNSARKIMKKIFTIPPSKETTYSRIKRLLGRKKINFFISPHWYDVDTIEDLKNYMEKNPKVLTKNLFTGVIKSLFQKRFLLLALEITTKCNLKCKHCYANATSFSKKELTLKDIKKIIKEAKGLGFKFVLITGGEPFLRKDILKILNYISKSNFKILLATNGTLLSSDIVKKLKKLKNLYSIKISIDGKEKTHDKIRRKKGSFKKAIESIKLLKRANLNVGINTTLMKENLKDLPYIIRLARKFKMEVSLKRFIPVGRGKEYFSSILTKKDILKIFKEICGCKGVKIKFTTEPQYNPYFLGKSAIKRIGGGCLAGISIITINSKGDYFPCTRLPIKLGNIRNQSLSQVILNSVILKKLEDRNNLKGKCKRCKFKMICGGCRAYAYALTGDYLEEDPLCVIKNIR